MEEENILNNANYAFHGINFDFFKLKSILEKGILSYRSARNSGILLNRNYHGFNEQDFVSLSESPSINGTFNYGAFATFVKGGIGIIVDIEKALLIKKGTSGIPGEILSLNIEPDEIVGIMIPSELQDIQIDKLFIMAGIGTGLIDSYALNFMHLISVNFGINYDLTELKNLIKSKKELSLKWKQEDLINKKINEFISHCFADAFKKYYGLSEMPTLLQTVSIICEKKLPIYNNHGDLLMTSIDNKKTSR